MSFVSFVCFVDQFEEDALTGAPAYDSPTVLPCSSISMRSAAGWVGRPGMVRISPASG